MAISIVYTLHYFILFAIKHSELVKLELENNYMMSIHLLAGPVALALNIYNL